MLINTHTYEKLEKRVPGNAIKREIFFMKKISENSTAQVDEEDMADEKNSHCTQKSELLHQRKRENQEREVAAAASKKCRIFAYSRSLLLQERDIPYQYRRQRFYGLPDLRAEDSSNFCNPGKNTSVHTENRGNEAQL